MNKLLIVTNASRSEAEAKLQSTGTWNPVDVNKAELVFFSGIQGLITYTKNTAHEGPVLFMFFHGMDFVEKTISSLIELTQDSSREFPLDYSLHSMCSSKRENATKAHMMTTSHFADLRFYFDSSIVDLNNTIDFCSIATIASSVLSKSGVLCDNRSLYIDDTYLSGNRDQPTRCLLRSFPGLDLKLGSDIY